MKLKGDKSGRKGHLSVATEVLALLPELQHWIYILVLFKPALATALRSDEESNIEHTSKKAHQ
jgi:hypothetical protein